MHKPSVLLALLLLAGCNQKITADNYARLQPGMARTDVEQLLGKPAECMGAIGLTSCTWGEQQRFISIQFAGDQVVLFSGKGLR